MHGTRVITRLAAGAALAVGLLASPLSGVASALDATDCAARVPQSADTDTVKMDRLEVDFGDGGEVEPRFQTARETYNRTPARTAVVCWKNGRDAAYVLGTLYWDRYAAGGGGIIIQVFDTDGDELRRVAEVVDSAAGQYNTRTVNRALEFDAIHGAGTVDAVRITAVRKLADGTIEAIGAGVTVRYGD